MKRFLKTVGILGLMALFFSTSARAEDPRDPDSPYGVLAFLPWNHDWNNYHYKTQDDLVRAVDLMKAAGIRMVRMDFLWADMEPAKGRFDFQKYA